MGLWSWYVLFTIAICLLITYPLIKLSKIIRILLIGFIFLITYPIHHILDSLRLLDSGWELLYHLLFYPVHEFPILPFFTSFCLGTIIGEIFYEIYSIKEENSRKAQIKKKIIRNFILYGTMVIITSILSNIFIFIDDISNANKSAFTMMLWGIGWDLVILGSLTYLHEFKFTAEWKHRFLFYFSYYSLTLYCGHNMVALIFWDRFDIYSIWIPVGITVILFWLISKILYEKLGPKGSIKWGISKLGTYLATRK